MNTKSNQCQECARGSGATHNSWKGGRIIGDDGYVLVYAPEHPRARWGRYAREHHVVMEQHLGRYLLPGESVHHKNGVRDDNRLENLELWTRPQPTGIRVEDAIEWAKEILRRYESSNGLDSQSNE